MSGRTRFLVFAVSTPLVLFVAVGGMLGATSTARQQSFPQLRVFEDVAQLIMLNYVEPADIDKVMDGAMRGLADGLDPSSAYLTPDEVRAIKTKTPEPQGEIGVVVTRQFYVRIVGVRDGSPAARAGLVTGDYLRMIDGRATRDMSALEGARLLRGAPGTKVPLLVLRGNDAEPHAIEVTREAAGSELTTSKTLPTGEGYVRVSSFRAGAAADLQKRLDAFRQSGVSRAIIDVRGTADGAIDEGIAAARLFVKTGPIATRAGRDGKPIVVSAGAGDGSVTMPIVLIVSRGTANAAEVFAAALQQGQRADLVGEPTAGIAALQRLVPLPDERGLWMTYERYLAADGKPIHERGLRPEVIAAEPAVVFGQPAPAADDLLAKALERLKSKK